MTIEFLKDFQLQLKNISVRVSLRDSNSIRKGSSRFMDTVISNSCTLVFDKMLSNEARISINVILYNSDSSITKHLFDFYSIPLYKDSINVLKIIFPKACIYNNHVLDNECPKCEMSDKVLPIKYGLLRQNKADKPWIDYVPGGCMVTGCDPSWYCKRDDFRF